MNAEQSRRAFLVGVGASVVGLVGLTAGQAFDPLAPFNLFAPRVKGDGPQGLPVNRTAAQVDVQELAVDPRWRLEVAGAAASVSLSRAELERMPQAEAVLPIACVEGWSSTARWRGVRLADLLSLVDADAGSAIRIESLQPRGAYRSSTMPAHVAWDPLTLVALEIGGEALDLDHGFPARIIAPTRPGVLQTKWLSTIREVTA